MKAVISFICCVTIVISNPVIPRGATQEDMEFFLYEDEHGEILIEDLTVEPENLTTSPTDVTYYFYSKNSQNGVKIHGDNISDLSGTAFDASKETVFSIHGWLNYHWSAMNNRVKESLMKSHDVNLFVVDWNPARRLYPSAQAALPQVGHFIGEFITSLVSTYHMDLGRVMIVGHSLGAHVAGLTGAALHGQVSRIVGLDPAGPLFSLANKNNRLDSSNAKLVEVIHTNAGLLGFGKSLGHSDYYPNGGKMQPGCAFDVAGTCSHHRSFHFFAESLNSNRFVGKQCGNIADYRSGKCDKGLRGTMGQLYPDSSRGVFYLETNGKAPYAKG